MPADTNSIFYKIGQATKNTVNNAITALKQANNTWSGTNDFKENVTIGDASPGGARSLKVYGVASTTDNLTVGGNLTVNGTTTTLSTSTLEVNDNFIHLSKGAKDGAYSKDSGLYFERGSDSDPQAIIWDESAARFTLGALETSTAVPATFQVGDAVNNIIVTLASGTPFTTVNITSGPETQFTPNGTTLELRVGATDTLDNIGAEVFLNENSYFDGTQPVLTGSGSTLAPTSGSIAISPEDPGGQVTGPDASTADVTPGKFLAGQLEIIDTTDGVLAVGDLADFNAGLVS